MRLNNFLANVDQLIKDIDEKEKKIALGGIIASLQRPIQEVIGSICEKQMKDAEELYKMLGWRNLNLKREKGKYFP